ncbi:MAG TPA: hypothetical protein VHD32_14075 [Candidatus Didemnitutus sp.]|nr:hypothetical protein [Candidatus Didemnitutus sp.]
MGGLPAQDQTDEWKPSALGELVSERDVRGVKHSGAAAVGSIAGDYAGLETAILVARPFASEPVETDLRAGYSWKWNESLATTLGATEYLYSSIWPGGTKRSSELSMGGKWTSPSGITWGADYARDLRLKADIVEGTAAYDYPLTSFGAFLEFRFFAGAAHGSDLRPDATGPEISDSYQFVGAEARLPYRIGAHLKITADVRFAASIGQDRAWSPINAGNGVHAGAGLSLDYEF